MRPGSVYWKSLFGLFSWVGAISKLIYCEITICDVLLMQILALIVWLLVIWSGQVRVGMKGSMKLNGYWTCTWTRQPGLLLFPLLMSHPPLASSLPEGPVPSHVVFTTSELALIPIPVASPCT